MYDKIKDVIWASILGVGIFGTLPSFSIDQLFTNLNYEPQKVLSIFAFIYFIAPVCVILMSLPDFGIHNQSEKKSSRKIVDLISSINVVAAIGLAVIIILLILYFTEWIYVLVGIPIIMIALTFNKSRSYWGFLFTIPLLACMVLLYKIDTGDKSDFLKLSKSEEWERSDSCATVRAEIFELLIKKEESQTIKCMQDICVEYQKKDCCRLHEYLRGIFEDRLRITNLDKEIKQTTYRKEALVIATRTQQRLEDVRQWGVWTLLIVLFFITFLVSISRRTINDPFQRQQFVKQVLPYSLVVVFLIMPLLGKVDSSQHDVTNPYWFLKISQWFAPEGLKRIPQSLNLAFNKNVYEAPDMKNIEKYLTEINLTLKDSLSAINASLGQTNLKLDNLKLLDSIKFKVNQILNLHARYDQIYELIRSVNTVNNSVIRVDSSIKRLDSLEMKLSGKTMNFLGIDTTNIR